MHVHASAPGKLVMAGDYAVLEGAPAVVLALDRRAHVDLAPSADNTFCVDAPDLGIRAVHGCLEAGHMNWTADAATIERLKLVTCVIETLAPSALPPAVHMTLDTQVFFADGGEAKLGLGSSAALTVALAGALASGCDRPAPALGAMIAMHRRMQAGRGSGLDIASSLLGGALVYQLRDGEPHARRAAWPADLAFCCVWSGRAASTGAALAQLADWRARQPPAYDAHMRELTAGATAVAAALEAGSATAMLEGMATYAGHLARLGAAASIDIVCAEHRALARMADACGAAYKTCGAGGGDVGVAVATDADRLAHFARQATSAGFHVLEAGIDTHGLSVASPITSQRRPSWTTYA